MGTSPRPVGTWRGLPTSSPAALVLIACSAWNRRRSSKGSGPRAAGADAATSFAVIGLGLLVYDDFEPINGIEFVLAAATIGALIVHAVLEVRAWSVSLLQPRRGADRRADGLGDRRRFVATSSRGSSNAARIRSSSSSSISTRRDLRRIVQHAARDAFSAVSRPARGKCRPRPRLPTRRRRVATSPRPPPRGQAASSSAPARRSRTRGRAIGAVPPGAVLMPPEVAGLSEASGSRTIRCTSTSSGPSNHRAPERLLPRELSR